MGYLDEKAAEVRARREAESPRGAVLEALRAHARSRNGIPSLRDALLRAEHVALIAEYKRRSPSAGALAVGEDPVEVARLYEQEGASGVSVLTDSRDFLGRLSDLEAVSTAVVISTLRKDFIVDEAGLCEARAAGAAAALLIMRMLARSEVQSLLACARDIGLECLVEVHDEAELDAALDAGATLVGINNRDLQTLVTDLSVTERLAPLVPAGVTLVSESGIRAVDDVKRVRDAGGHAVLVGESLLRLPRAERARRVAELAGVDR